jgi:lysophospholipase L1-like esterase
MSSTKITALLCLLFVHVIVGQMFPRHCTPLPPHNATSIFDLRPGSIKVIMAFGDSITSGFGVTNAFNESRGASFSMGGDSNAITLPNLFQYYNPALVGYSTDSYPAEICYGNNCPAVRYYAQDANNAAKSGAMVFDVVGTQINYLIRQVNTNPNMDVQNDWKVLTIMIGANDVCASCTFNVSYLSPDDYQSNLMGTLERIRTSLPRTFVNLVSSFNISQAYDLSLQTDRCTNISRPYFIQCDCLFQPDAGAIREAIDAQLTEFNQRAVLIARYYQSKAYTNFAVVVQPFATNTYISDLPSRFLSDLDCFHPSKAGQQAMAIALWNSMLTPAANKKTSLDMEDEVICPQADTLLYTF